EYRPTSGVADIPRLEQRRLPRPRGPGVAAHGAGNVGGVRYAPLQAAGAGYEVDGFDDAGEGRWG
ncbi:hypothetical protein V492_02698, partial [Pseudogymnoascus sp. VKM F-4246]